MTGFGRATAESDSKKITVEIKTVNNRYLEILPRMPKTLIPLEDKLKKAIGAKINRGRVEVFISLEEQAGEMSDVKVNKDLAKSYYDNLQELKDFLNFDDEKISFSRIFSMPGVITLEKSEEDLEELEGILLAATNEALDQLIAMRLIEGEKMSEDLLARKCYVAGKIIEITERAPLVVAEYRKRLAIRIADLTAEGCVFDEGRLEAEVATFADRASIAEEITRLNSHLQQLENMLQCDDVVGRKLDFLLQELNREINTIGSKANDLTISTIVIDTKAEFEKIREQVQNIE